MIHETIEIWGKGTYKGEGEDGFHPTLETYILDGTKKRGAVLICPGGGYHITAKREAEPVAMQFNAAGFHAFVLYYSVAPRKHPQPLLDVSKAMCILRKNAEKWNIASDKIAVCGFSAGGHLAASLGVHWNKPYLRELPGMEEGMNHPNALILCYPLITDGIEEAIRGSFENLLGEQTRDKQLLKEMCLEQNVNPETSPAFIWHTFNDAVVPVEHSMLFAEALRKNNIPFELHIFPEGPHGLSIATDETYEEGIGKDYHVATWMGLCTEWLKHISFRQKGDI